MPMPNNFKRKSDELKPREQLMRSASVADVADDTLLAILLKTGSNGCDVVELSRRLISAFGSLKELVNSDECFRSSSRVDCAANPPAYLVEMNQAIWASIKNTIDALVKVAMLADPENYAKRVKMLEAMGAR